MKAKKTKPAPEKIEKANECLGCGGTGEKCEECGLGSNDCDCGDTQFEPCDDCYGSGKADD